MLCPNCLFEIPEGSDRCPNCISLDANPTSTSEFAYIAEENEHLAESKSESTAPKNECSIPVFYASQSTADKTTVSDSAALKKRPLSRVPKPALIAGVVIAVFLMGFLVISESGKGALKGELTGTWAAGKGSIIKVLEIEESSMTYKLETGYGFLNSSLAIWQWRPTGLDSFEISRTGSDWESHTVQFSADKKLITIKPALPSTDSYETWVHIN